MDFSLQNDDFGGDYSATRASGSKRSFGDLEVDISGSKKCRTDGVATGMILSLRESLQNCKDDLASCQNELESANAEINKWKSAAKTPQPRFLIDYIQNLESSERCLKEELDIAKRKEASCIVQYAKREQDVAELKSAVRDLKSKLKPASMQARRLLLDPPIHQEFSRLKNLVEEKDKKIKELEDNIAAITFTTQSKNGKLLVAKCRILQEENEAMGYEAAEGKIHELAMKLAMHKSQNAQFRSQFEGLFKHMEKLTNDVERSNETVVRIIAREIGRAREDDRESKERDAVFI